MTQPRRRGIAERYVVAPAREIVLFFKDARSPEMKEAYDIEQVAELMRLGEDRYMFKNAGGFAGVMTLMNFLTYLPRIVSGRATWGSLLGWKFIGSSVVLAVVFGIVGIAVASHRIGRLQDEYLPKKDAPE